MNRYLSTFKNYFKMNKNNKVTLRIRYQRFIENFNKSLKFRVKVISFIFLISK